MSLLRGPRRRGARPRRGRAWRALQRPTFARFRLPRAACSHLLDEALEQPGSQLLRLACRCNALPPVHDLRVGGQCARRGVIVPHHEAVHVNAGRELRAWIEGGVRERGRERLRGHLTNAPISHMSYPPDTFPKQSNPSSTSSGSMLSTGQQAGSGCVYRCNCRDLSTVVTVTVPPPVAGSMSSSRSSETRSHLPSGGPGHVHHGVRELSLTHS